MSAPDPQTQRPGESKPTLVDVIHEWLGQSGLRKIWGMQTFGDCDPIPIPKAELFLRETDVPYFNIWSTGVVDKGDYTYKSMIFAHDPEFFTKLRKMLDYREQSNTIVCRCSQCEGTKR